MKLGIIVFCTGKYRIFLDKYITTCEEKFLPNMHKTYFIFTEDTVKFDSNISYKHIPFKKLGWPEKPVDGITIYHFDHSRISYEKIDESRKVNPTIVTLEYLQSLVNDDNWGCNDLELSERVITA